MTAEDTEALREAKRLLEYPGLAARLSDLLGRPVESVIKALPKGWNSRISAITQATLGKCLDIAITTLGAKNIIVPAGKKSGYRLHNAMATASGALGGAFGLPALAIELPVSTSVMLRAIARIAAEEGEDLSMMESRLSCLTVLALGGSRQGDEAAETGYWAVRGILAKSVSDAASHIVRRGVTAQGAPPIVRLLATVASRFHVRVTQQVAAKAVPVIGAVAGGAINYAFTDHFQKMARGHYTVRRLERKYGSDVVRRTYEILGV